MEFTNSSEVLGVAEVLADAGASELTEEKFADIASAIFSADSGTSEIRDLLGDWGSVSKSFSSTSTGNVIRGYCHFLLADLPAAEEILRKEKKSEWGFYYLIRVVLAQGRLAEASELVGDARSKFPGTEAIDYLAIEVACRTKRSDDARKLLSKHSGQAESSAAYSFHEGLYLESIGEYKDAMAWYRKAADIEPRHAEALFRYAYILEIYGEGDTTDLAIEAYEECLKITPAHTNAVLNLGILYEDRERYHDAVRCFETVLQYFPDHERARLFLKDSEASTRMFYDKDQERKADKHSQVLKIPVTDFELSVRSRNCLQKMKIDTLGDLIVKTEQELLAYKNFGETSLKEIKDMLTQKGLKLGQGVENRATSFSPSRNPLEATVSPDVLDRTIESLELSIRSRRCMERLEVKSLRDLINKTEVELMSAKNFGMTSLNEIKRKLADLGLSLKS